MGSRVAVLNTSWLALVLLITVSLTFLSVAKAKELEPYPAPEFTHQESQDWINTWPLSIKGLQGKVVMLDFWTFDCWNCYRSFPWLHDVEEKYKAQNFLVIGIHTPEFAHERKLNRVKDKVRGYGLKHPIMIDNDFSYWNAMGTRFWPTYYLIDKQGQVRYIFFGETHNGDAQSKKVDKAIQTLLSE